MRKPEKREELELYERPVMEVIEMENSVLTGSCDTDTCYEEMPEVCLYGDEGCDEDNGG